VSPLGNGAASRNDAVRPAASRLPKPSRWAGRRNLLVAGGIGLVALAGIIAAYIVIQKPFRHLRTDLVTHKVRYDRMELTVVERGALESANNSDVYCRVKSGSKGAVNATTIKTVIDDGSHVLKDRPKDQVRSILSWNEKNAVYLEKTVNSNGFARVLEVQDKEAGDTNYSDLIVELDDSGLQDQLKTQKIALDLAEANKISAEENYKIIVSQNQSDIQTKQTALELAKIDLEKYQNGDFPQSLKDVEGRIKVAESDAEQQRDRAAWAQRMLKKGYYTVSQADSEQSKLQSCELSLAKVLEERRVLTDPGYGLKKRTETDLKNKLVQAKDELERAIGQAHAKEVTARTDRETKKSVYEQEKTRYEDIVAEIKKCKIMAPQDGIVVYYVPEQARYGGGSQQSIVAQGEPVREGQKLMQIPDLKHMLVNTKVHEAMVSRVHKGQPALVRVDSFPDRPLHGQVDSIATISSQQDFMSADVKVYTTKVAIDEIIEGLKPGMNAAVTITIGDVLEHVLTVPIQAIVGSAEMGKRRKCFVLTPEGPVERDIVVGMSNEKMAEIRDGLQEGEEVVLNPKAIIGDKLKTREPGSLKREEEGSEKGPGDRPRRAGPRPGAGEPPNGNGGALEKAGPGSGPGGEPGRTRPGGQMSPEERERRQKEMLEQFRALTPEQRKERLEQIPADRRGFIKQMLQGQGIDIKD
jgi:multidrug resistance efflux pump